MPEARKAEPRKAEPRKHEAHITVDLTPTEYWLITSLRDMPESRLKERVLVLVDELSAFARNPRCCEMQADGVPCEHPERDCDQCELVTRMLDDLERRVPRG